MFHTDKTDFVRSSQFKAKSLTLVCHWLWLTYFPPVRAANRDKVRHARNSCSASVDICFCQISFSKNLLGKNTKNKNLRLSVWLFHNGSFKTWITISYHRTPKITQNGVWRNGIKTQTSTLSAGSFLIVHSVAWNTQIRVQFYSLQRVYYKKNR